MSTPCGDADRRSQVGAAHLIGVPGCRGPIVLRMVIEGLWRVPHNSGARTPEVPLKYPYSPVWLTDWAS